MAAMDVPQILLGSNQSEYKEMKEIVDRQEQTPWWSNGYGGAWDNDELKHRLRVTRETYILEGIGQCIYKQPTNMVPVPIEENR